MRKRRPLCCMISAIRMNSGIAVRVKLFMLPQLTRPMPLQRGQAALQQQIEIAGTRDGERHRHAGRQQQQEHAEREDQLECEFHRSALRRA